MHYGYNDEWEREVFMEGNMKDQNWTNIQKNNYKTQERYYEEEYSFQKHH